MNILRKYNTMEKITNTLELNYRLYRRNLRLRIVEISQYIRTILIVELSSVKHNASYGKKCPSVVVFLEREV